ncbi:hypothetical protein [Xenorhabdus hominickii]|uniref:hypothetical protein n=1 Tax=Xenorhabdus hominickii TaxID=351679 RepID=UPI0012EE1920
MASISANTLSDDINRIMQSFERLSSQGHRSGFAQKQERLPDVPLMRQNPIITILY